MPDPASGFFCRKEVCEKTITTLRNLNYMNDLLKIYAILAEYPEAEKTQKSILDLYDHYAEKLPTEITSHSSELKDKVSVEVDQKHIVNESRYGYLIHISPQAMITCRKMEHHCNRQNCWISNKISELKHDKLKITIYPESYFLMFDMKNSKAKTTLNSSEMLNLLMNNER